MSHRKQWVVGAAIGLALSSFVWMAVTVYHRISPTKVAVSPLTSALPESNGTDANPILGVMPREPFAPYEYVASKYVPGVPSGKVVTSELSNIGAFKKGNEGYYLPIEFTDEEMKALGERNFFVTDATDASWDENPDQIVGRSDDWSKLYTQYGGAYDMYFRTQSDSVFVSTDYLLHTYHRLLEKEFEHIEQAEFTPRLVTLSQALLDRSLALSASAKDADAKASYMRLAGYFAVPAALLDASRAYSEGTLTADKQLNAAAPKDVLSDAKSDTLDASLTFVAKYGQKLDPATLDAVRKELGYIYDAKDMAVAPLYGKYRIVDGVDLSKEDYTQFGPRSHYAKNPILRSYFRAMMWYGRQNLLLASPELTRDALNTTLMMNDPALMKDWEAIYKPTSFFVGESDDLGIYEYHDALAKRQGNFDWSAASISAIVKDLVVARNPAIQSSVAVSDDMGSESPDSLRNKTKGFRFMGQRFTPDAFIFTNLTQGGEGADSGTAQKLPSMTTALLPMAALGSTAAEQHVPEWIAKNAPDSDKIIPKKLAELKHLFGSLDGKVWEQNIYWGWLGTIRTLFQDKKDFTGYPYFMGDANWRSKDLRTALGSWTELKHDTLLYAKQSYAELGGGGPDTPELPPVPKGYVEPNIEFFDRLIPLAKMTYEGLKGMDLLDSEFTGRNETFLGSIDFYRAIALAEVGNTKISDDDFERLRREPAKFESILHVLSGEDQTEDEARSALIADVHTDVPGGQVLYEANAYPKSVFVAVEDTNGTRLTRGLVYDYYEFAGPLAKRLTDQDWRKSVYTHDDQVSATIGDGKVPFPAAPKWSTDLER